MSLLRNLFEGRGRGRGEAREATLSQILEATGGSRMSSTGISVGPDSALRLGSVWRSVNLIADLTAGFPVDAFRRQAGIRIPVEPAPVLLSDPSPGMLDLDWRRTVLVSWLLRGNAAGIVSSSSSLGYPLGIELAHPDELAIWKDRGKWRYRLAGRERFLYPEGDLWHVPAFTMPGSRIGLSPISYAAESIGLGLAVRRFGSEWFSDGGHPTAILSTEQEVGPDLAALIKKRFLDATRGRREPAVLGAGLEYKPIQISPEESQFLETTRANVADVARYFGVPPELIGGESGGSLTYANVEQRALDLLTYTVSAWVLRLEKSLTALLPRGQYVKLNVDSLLRTSLVDRMHAHEVAIRNGIRSRNEARAIEDEAPIPDDPDPAFGDEFLWPPMRSTPLPPGTDARGLPRSEEDR